MEQEIGEITHFFGNIGVGVIKLNGVLKTGDQIHFLGHGADFTQEVESMQVEHEQIETAQAGDEVGLKVTEKVKPGTKVFLVKEE